MAAQNDITGDSIQSRVLSQEGRDNWDRIFGKQINTHMNLQNEKKTLKEWKREYGLADQDVLTNPLLEEIESPTSATMTRAFFEQVYNVQGNTVNGAKLL